MSKGVPEGYSLPDTDEGLLEECTVTWFRSSGPGGQHKNKSETAVRLRHEPTGIVTVGQRERSQSRNLKDAVTRLREKLEKLLHKPKPRKATKPSRQAREKRLQEKKQQAQKKDRRQRPDPD